MYRRMNRMYVINFRWFGTLFHNFKLNIRKSTLAPVQIALSTYSVHTSSQVKSLKTRSMIYEEDDFSCFSGAEEEDADV